MKKATKLFEELIKYERAREESNTLYRILGQHGADLPEHVKSDLYAQAGIASESADRIAKKLNL